MCDASLPMPLRNNQPLMMLKAFSCYIVHLPVRKSDRYLPAMTKSLDEGK